MGNYPLKVVVALGIQMMDDHGYMSVADAKQNKHTTFSTAQQVKSILHSSKDWDMGVDVDKVEEVVSYVYQLVPPDNISSTGKEYYDRLTEVYSKPEVKYEEVGLVVSALSFFNNPKMPSSEYTKLISHSKHFGKLKHRDNFFVKLLKETHIQSHDDYYVYKFITREGNLGFFFKGDKLTIKPGECFLFKGTPIEHNIDRYDKVPITKFNRIAFLENHGTRIGEQ